MSEDLFFGMFLKICFLHLEGRSEIDSSRVIKASESESTITTHVKRYDTTVKTCFWHVSHVRLKLLKGIFKEEHLVFYCILLYITMSGNCLYTVFCSVNLENC